MPQSLVQISMIVTSAASMHQHILGEDDAGCGMWCHSGYNYVSCVTILRYLLENWMLGCLICAKLLHYSMAPDSQLGATCVVVRPAS